MAQRTANRDLACPLTAQSRQTRILVISGFPPLHMTARYEISCSPPPEMISAAHPLRALHKDKNNSHRRQSSAACKPSCPPVELLTSLGLGHVYAAAAAGPSGLAWPRLPVVIWRRASWRMQPFRGWRSKVCTYPSGERLD